MSTIRNAASLPLFNKSGSIPDVSGAMLDYFQPMVFNPVGKIVKGFQVVEIGTPINFRGVIQPLQGTKLIMKPEGQRGWSWYLVHSDPLLSLVVDDVVTWNGKQTRVMSQKDVSLYGYMEYEMVQDWTGSGPS